MYHLDYYLLLNIEVCRSEVDRVRGAYLATSIHFTSSSSSILIHRPCSVSVSHVGRRSPSSQAADWGGGGGNEGLGNPLLLSMESEPDPDLICKA